MNATEKPIARAVRVAGSQAKLAALLGVRQQAVRHWYYRKVPAERVLEIERATGVSRHELRPDLYPIEAA